MAPGVTKPWPTVIIVAVSGRPATQTPSLDDSALPDPPLSYMLSPKAMSDIQQGKLWNF